MQELPQPYFERHLVEDRRLDGYWIEAFDIDNDSKPDIVGYGLNVGEVNWYQNPDWKKINISKFLGPVGMHHADIDGDGWNDIVLCYQYGQTMVNCDPDGGKIVWVRLFSKDGIVLQSESQSAVFISFLNNDDHLS